MKKCVCRSWLSERGSFTYLVSLQGLRGGLVPNPNARKKAREILIILNIRLTVTLKLELLAQFIPLFIGTKGLLNSF